MRLNWTAKHHAQKALTPTAREWLLEVRTERLGDDGESMGTLEIRESGNLITLSIENYRHAF